MNSSISKWNQEPYINTFSMKSLQDYEVISIIGSGTFGTCFKVRDKQTGEIYAWKGMDYEELSDSKKESLISEINVLRELKHPNIVQYYHHLVNHEAKSIFIVMECCEGGDLAQLILKCRRNKLRFEEKYIWRVLFQISKALQLCHNKIQKGTILHRDIKPANIFLDLEGNIKLGDFGLARLLRRNESFAETFVGTPYYMSPEIINCSKYDRKSDVWAVGCLTYEMCALRTPFKGQQFDQLSKNISDGKFNNIPSHYSKDMQDIISFMLEVDNDDRPSIEVITRHPILIRNVVNLGNDFPKLVANEDIEISFQIDNLSNPNLTSTAVKYSSASKSLRAAFTSDSRRDSFTFYSYRRDVCSKSLCNSDSKLYESVINNEKEDKTQCKKFEYMWEQKLNEIRLKETMLEKRESVLEARELKLIEREKQLIKIEKNLLRKHLLKDVNLQKNRLSFQEVLPLPPKMFTTHDESYCSIDPNDTQHKSPTVAKLNKAELPTLKSFPPRRVTFISPKKFINYNIENIEGSKTIKTENENSNINLRPSASVSSKGSEDSNDSNFRKKSILALFGFHRGQKDKSKASTISNKKVFRAPTVSSKVPAAEVLSKCETTDLANIWSDEKKTAAFNMLAAMNAAEQEEISKAKLIQPNRTKYRQSVREQSSLQRHKLQRSLPRISSSNKGGRILI